MSERVEILTGTWEKQDIPTGESTELERPSGVWQRQELSTTLFCGEETICCGDEHYACGGGYISPKVSKPTGVWEKVAIPT